MVQLTGIVKAMLQTRQAECLAQARCGPMSQISVVAADLQDIRLVHARHQTGGPRRVVSVFRNSYFMR